MPRLNPLGQAAMGIGNSPGSVDTVTLLTPGGGLCWLTDDTLIAQTVRDGRYQVVTVTLDGTQAPLYDHGANDLCAGGGRWLGWASGFGLFGSLDLPAAGLRAAGSDGTLAYCPNYQSGVGLVLNAGGVDYAVPNAVYSADVQVIGPRAALWYDGRTIQSIGIPAPRPALSSGRMRRVVVGAETWLVYWAGYAVGLVAQVDGADDGYILEPRPIAFNHDAVCVGGELVVAWSVTQGEAPSDLRNIVVDRSKPRQRLVATPEPPEPTPEPPDPPTPQPEPPEPVPVPPQPPVLPYGHHSKGHTMEIDGKTVILRGPAGLLGYPAALNTGPWGGLGAGWRGFAWAGAHDTGNDVTHHRAAKLSNGRYTFTSASNGLAGADATKHSGSIGEQFYYKPDGNTDAGDYEQWRVYDGNENGALEAQIEYRGEDGAYFSCPLAVEVVG